MSLLKVYIFVNVFLIGRLLVFGARGELAALS